MARIIIGIREMSKYTHLITNGGKAYKIRKAFAEWNKSADLVLSKVLVKINTVTPKACENEMRLPSIACVARNLAIQDHKNITNEDAIVESYVTHDIGELFRMHGYIDGVTETTVLEAKYNSKMRNVTEADIWQVQLYMYISKRNTAKLIYLTGSRENIEIYHIETIQLDIALCENIILHVTQGILDAAAPLPGNTEIRVGYYRTMKYRYSISAKGTVQCMCGNYTGRQIGRHLAGIAKNSDIHMGDE